MTKILNGCQLVLLAVISLVAITAWGCSEKPSKSLELKRMDAVHSLKSARAGAEDEADGDDKNYFLKTYDKASTHLETSSGTDLEKPFLFSAIYGVYDDGTHVARVQWLESLYPTKVLSLQFVGEQQQPIGDVVNIEDDLPTLNKYAVVKLKIVRSDKLPDGKVSRLSEGRLLVTDEYLRSIKEARLLYSDVRTGERKTTNAAVFHHTSRAREVNETPER